MKNIIITAITNTPNLQLNNLNLKLIINIII